MARPPLTKVIDMQPSLFLVWWLSPKRGIAHSDPLIEGMARDHPYREYMAFAS
jgi:hypothetical protein